MAGAPTAGELQPEEVGTVTMEGLGLQRRDLTPEGKTSRGRDRIY